MEEKVASPQLSITRELCNSQRRKEKVLIAGNRDNL